MDVEASEASSTQEASPSARVAKWVNKSDHLTILVFGNLGSGKSSLINTILEKEVAEEGSKVTGGVTKVTKPFHGEKENIKLLRTTTTINNIKITLWDTPGLQDPLEKEGIIKEIKEKCSGDRIDLFLYCTDIRQTRIRHDDFTAVKELTEALGEDIWKNAIFTLNFTNQVCLTETRDDEKQSLESFCRDRVFQWKKGLRKAVLAAGVPESVVVLIPIVPTSYRKIPLPTKLGTEWFKDFWSACVRQVRFSSLPAVLKLKIPYAVYVGHRLSGMSDYLEEQALEEKMLKEEENLKTEGLIDIPAGRFMDYVAKAVVSTANQGDVDGAGTPREESRPREDSQINPWGVVSIAVTGCAVVAAIVLTKMR